MPRVSFKHWQQAKEVFAAALEYSVADRSAFLEQACKDDPELRREVESLLKSYEAAASFMETPAVESAAESLVNEQPLLEVGELVKHYEILAPLGVGGMGEVYLARDTILGRRIALKFLPQYLLSDPDRLRRFKQEARAASTLNHPNVCVIHEVGETEAGHPFITMEYIDGCTLRQRMNEGLGLKEALDIAVQVADALTAAHEAGIVHRDIKPENIMIRRDGYVKVLDFGLAKLTEHRGATGLTMSTLMAHSSPGSVMGTAAYMSPEQARGVSIDGRTDIWSLGVVLYEMVTGHPPFAGATPTDVVIAIVERDQASISEQIGEVPAELERIVRKALRKNPEERYQIVKEMSIDLRSLQKELEITQSSAPALASATTSGQRKIKGTQPIATTDEVASRLTILGAAGLADPGFKLRLVLTTLILLALSFGAFGTYKWLQTSPATVTQPGRFQRINVTKLTTNGSAAFASISPDGKYVSYIKSEGGKESLWLRQVASAGNLELIPPREGHYGGLTFSRDGDFIYYGYAEPSEQNGEVYKVPVLGAGTAPVRVSPEQGLASTSHDGKRIAFIQFDRANQADILKVANADGSNQQVVTTRRWPDRLTYDFVTLPAWTPDDQNLVLPVVKNDSSRFSVALYSVNVATHAEQTINLSDQQFEQPYHLTLLSDLSGVVFSAKAQGASFSQIWFLGRDGSARTITNDLSDYRDADLTSQSNALVTVQTQTLSNMWLTTKADSKPSQITAGVGRYFDATWAPDGKLVYASDASGSADIYELAADGTQTRQLTSGMKRNYAPSVSPDNRFIVFHSNRSGIFQIWRMDRDGSNPLQLTSGNDESNWPCFSADSKWVFYQHFESGAGATLWKVPVEGGAPSPVLNGFALRPTLSPDGKWLAFWQTENTEKSRWYLSLVSLDGQGTHRTFEIAPTMHVQWDTQLRWTGDSKSLTYIDSRAGIENIWAQPIEGGQPKQVTNSTDSRIFSFAWSKDGNLVVSRGVITSDVVLITDPQQ